MKTLTLTQARRQLGELVDAAEPVERTRRGVPIGTPRPSVRAPYNRDAAIEAARGIRELGERLATWHKPSKKHGGTRALRELRDHGS